MEEEKENETERRKMGGKKYIRREVMENRKKADMKKMRE